MPIDLGGTSYSLIRCDECGFQYKDPPISEDALLACYAKATSDHWGDQPEAFERSLGLLKAVVERKAPGPAVLDIGCSNGALLEFFGPRWQRFGVEPGTLAARLAEERGVKILGRTLEDIVPGMMFDAAMAIDVVEHIADPTPFFRAVASCLRPGGVFVIQTGDTDAWTWRLEGSRYWYCSLPEHVSFYNRRAMSRLAEQAGMISVEHIRLTHSRQPIKVRAAELLKNLGYVAGLSVRGGGVPALERLFVQRRAPGWLTSRDHMLHVMKAHRPACADRPDYAGRAGS